MKFIGVFMLGAFFLSIKGSIPLNNEPQAPAVLATKIDQELIDSTKALNLIGIRNALRAGANPNAFGTDGQTALQAIAVSKGFQDPHASDDYSLCPQIVVKLINFGADSTKSSKGILSYSPLEAVADRLLITGPRLPLAPMARAFLQNLETTKLENSPYQAIGKMVLAALDTISKLKSWNEEGRAEPFYHLIEDALKAGFHPKQIIDIDSSGKCDAFVTAQKKSLPRAYALFVDFRARQFAQAQKVLNVSLPIASLHQLIFEY